jgi:hypothetical protein
MNEIWIPSTLAQSVNLRIRRSLEQVTFSSADLPRVQRSSTQSISWLVLKRPGFYLKCEAEELPYNRGRCTLRVRRQTKVSTTGRNTPRADIRADIGLRRSGHRRSLVLEPSSHSALTRPDDQRANDGTRHARVPRPSDSLAAAPSYDPWCLWFVKHRFPRGAFGTHRARSGVRHN